MTAVARREESQLKAGEDLPERPESRVTPDAPCVHATLYPVLRRPRSMGFQRPGQDHGITFVPGTGAPPPTSIWATVLNPLGTVLLLAAGGFALTLPSWSPAATLLHRALLPASGHAQLAPSPWGTSRPGKG